MRSIGVLYALAAIVAWGANFPYTKLILEKTSPEVFLIFRFGIGTCTLFFLTRLNKTPFTFDKKHIKAIILAGCIGVILHQLIQLSGLKHTTATNTGWIITLNPPVTDIFAWLFLKERIGLRQFFGLAVAMSGLLLFVSKGDPSTLSFIHNYGDLLALVTHFPHIGNSFFANFQQV